MPVGLVGLVLLLGISLISCSSLVFSVDSAKSPAVLDTPGDGASREWRGRERPRRRMSPEGPAVSVAKPSLKEC